MQIAKQCSLILTYPLLLLLRIYQLVLSPMLGKNCRFHPTCSCYAHESLTRYGVIKGSYLTTIRILKCNPLHPGGFDYVPLAKEKQCNKSKQDLNKQNTTM